MLRERYLRVYDLHSWSGMVLGLFLFLVSITGCFALFDHEIKTWENHNLRLELPENPIPINDNFLQWVDKELGDNEPLIVGITFPNKYEPYYRGRLQFKDQNKQRVTRFISWNATNGEVLKERGGGLSEWVLDFHRDLMWPKAHGGRQIGRAIVGIAGIIMMLSIISGILTHTKIIREFFTLRFKNTIRLKWTDTHKALGLWALPFYSMISFTGAFLGIIAILSPIIALLAFKGDTAALTNAVFGEPTKATGVQEKMLSMDEVRRLRNPQSDTLPNSVLISNWGDSAAEYRIFYPVNNELSRTEEHIISGVSGKSIKFTPTSKLTTPRRISASITPLHYGTYGGIWLKALYFILGISLCVLIATGLIMWIERRLHGKEGTRSEQFYRRLGRITIGATIGLAIATAALFYLDKLYQGSEDHRLWWTGVTYFAVWFATIAFSLIKQIGEYKLVRVLLKVTAILFLAIPILNASYYMQTPPNFSQPWAVVDFGFVITGLVLFALTLLIPTHRQQPERKSRKLALA